MTCHECHLEIFIPADRFVKLKKNGSEIYFHNRNRRDCWRQFRKRHPKLKAKKR